MKSRSYQLVRGWILCLVNACRIFVLNNFISCPKIDVTICLPYIYPDTCFLAKQQKLVMTRVRSKYRFCCSGFYFWWLVPKRVSCLKQPKGGTPSLPGPDTIPLHWPGGEVGWLWPPWILKRGGLKSFGQRQISLNSKTKTITFFESVLLN